MEFIYRLPLFDFDTEIPEELEKHRTTILAAIALSSPDLAQELEKKPFGELERKLGLKLRKYLLRGRYRPTPFGLLAGVGTGQWGTENRLELPIQSKVLGEATLAESQKTIENSDPTVKYYSMPGIHRLNGHYHATVYDNQSQRWAVCKIPENPLMDQLLDMGRGSSQPFHPSSNQPIDFKHFSSLLGIRNTKKRNLRAKSLWNDLLNTGILSPADLSRPSKATGIDLVLDNRIELSNTVKSTLDDFMETAGNLFAPEGSPYLTAFILWFISKYDDRFVKLDALLRERDFVSGRAITTSNPSSPSQESIASRLLETCNSGILDLSQCLPKTPLPPSIHDLQLVFRIDSSGDPVIENMVCNRPFVYLGRFLRDTRIANNGHATRETIYRNPDILYTHVELLETDTVNHICNVQNLFGHRISPFPGDGEAHIGFGDLWIGIAHNRIVLVHEKTGRQVVPVILHPLNASQITHPVLRLLWETAHQDRHRFLPYQSPALQNLSHFPQLNWGKLCLQARRWKLKKENHPNPKSLNDRLDALEAPRHLLAGSLDRELLLDRSHQNDLEIFWQELRRQGTLTVTEARWHSSRQFASPQGQSLYPQFVYRRSKPLESPEVGHLFNPREEPHSDTLELHIYAQPLDIPDVLELLLVYMSRNRKNTPQWFFMHYGRNGNAEIRLRLISLCPIQKKRWTERLVQFFGKEGWDWKVAEYFPEYLKYGRSCLPLSHLLFCMESTFLAGPSRRGTSNFHLPIAQKDTLILSLWLLHFKKSPFQRELFKALQAQVMNISVSETQKFKREYVPITRRTFFGFPAAEYHNTLYVHSFFTESATSAITLLFNHLHMICNRFFPEDTRVSEARILYRLYRELGKSLHTDSQKPTKKKIKSRS